MPPAPPKPPAPPVAVASPVVWACVLVCAWVAVRSPLVLVAVWSPPVKVLPPLLAKPPAPPSPVAVMVGATEMVGEMVELLSEDAEPPLPPKP